MILAVSGAGLVLVFGLLVTPTWHNELLWFRILVTVAVVALTAFALSTKKWNLVQIAGGIGVAGFVIWVLMLLSGHDLSELTSLETDGVTNGLFVVGSALVLFGGRWVLGPPQCRDRRPESRIE
jgi:hypothetical protein